MLTHKIATAVAVGCLTAATAAQSIPSLNCSGLVKSTIAPAAFFPAGVDFPRDQFYLLSGAFGFQRRSDGALLRLPESAALLAVWSDLVTRPGTTDDDNEVGRLSAARSLDDGRTWEEPRPFKSPPQDAINLCCPSLLRVQGRNLLLYGTLREAVRDLTVSVAELSEDAAGISGESEITPRKEYHAPLFGNAILLASGRIVYPVAKLEGTRYVSYMYFSEPSPGELAGKTWRHSRGISLDCGRGALEPSVAEYAPNSILAVFRTQRMADSDGPECRDKIAFATSNDGGETWSSLTSLPFNGASVATTLAKLRSGKLVAFYNSPDRTRLLVRTTRQLMDWSNPSTWSEPRVVDYWPNMWHTYVSALVEPSNDGTSNDRLQLTYWQTDHHMELYVPKGDNRLQLPTSLKFMSVPDACLP